MKILLTGRNGQLGYELERSLQSLGKVLAVDRSQFDLTKPDQMRSLIRDFKPNLLVNPAAYTAVDLAEAEPSLAHVVNSDAPALMADEMRLLGGAMVHYSTDYVFDGTKTGAYHESDVPNPQNAYGRTKLLGEQAIAASGVPHLILRTSWLYSRRSKNFFLTILRLARERPQLRIVNDQIGAPTWCRTVADTSAFILASLCGGHFAEPKTHVDHEAWKQRAGLYHLTCDGSTSWHGFAKAIVEGAQLEQVPEIVAIPSVEYPTPATRPLNSVLSCSRLTTHFCTLPDWRLALALCQN